MKYYPKSQIKTNLYTKGDEFYVFSSKEIYIGYYWGTSDGKFYTGKDQNDNPVYEIIPILETNPVTLQPEKISEQDIINNTQYNSYYVYNEEYFNSKKISINQNASVISKSYIPSPSSENYNKGNIDRYFIKKANEILFIEISYSDYIKYINNSKDVPSELYIPFSINWIISGNKEQAILNNQASAYKIERRYGYYGFYNYLNKFDFLYK